MMSNDIILNHLIILEKSLSIKENKLSFSYMDNILTDDFIEFGKSGKIHSKLDNLKLCKLQVNIPSLILENFKLKNISNSAKLITYISIDTDSNERCNRSSIWVFQSKKWRMLFHQGTYSD